jgi:hypothetical protein
MKLTLIILFAILFSALASAKDDYNRYSIEEAISTSEAKKILNPGYTFSFGSQSHGPGNAVINIRSYYKKRDFRSNVEFECGNGSIMAGVTMIGDVVTLE